MTDVHDRETRRRNMQAIHSRDTKPEIMLRKALHHRGYRYRISPCGITGKPDIWLPRYNAAIFVHGCFWHVHGCSRFRWPKTRTNFWKHKLLGNRTRDEKHLAALKKQKIRTLVVWECALRGKGCLGAEITARLTDTWLKSGTAEAEIDNGGLTIKQA